MVEQKEAIPYAEAIKEEVEPEMEVEFIMGHHFEKIGFNKIAMCMEKFDRYVFVTDAYGQCDIFFNYSPHIICNVAKEMVKVTLGKTRRVDVCEVMRKFMVRAMRDGMFLILNLD